MKSRTHRLSARHTAIMAVGALAVAVLPTLSSAAVVAPRLRSDLVTVGRLAMVPSGATRLGSLPVSRTLNIGVALRPRNAAALARFADAISTPGNPAFHHFLSSAAFIRRFAPSNAVVARVAKTLTGLGLRVGSIPRDRLLVPFTGSVGAVETALHTNLVAYRLAAGTPGWTATSAPRLPRFLAGSVSAIVGLDNLVTPVSGVQRVLPRARAVAKAAPLPVAASGPSACASASSLARGSGGWTESDIAGAYGVTSLYDKGDIGAGQTIALFELEPFLMSDVATFDRCMFGASHTPLISLQPVDGFNLSGPGAGEAALDVEELSALAPAAHIVVYEAPNTTFGALDNYAQMVSEDRANLITTSWGECEQALAVGAPGAAQLENLLFEEAAAQGQTVFASSGDDGSDDCANTLFSSTTPVAPHLSVDDPGSQPYVVSVGGTSLTSDHQPLDVSAETVWNDGARGGGAGGGVSSNWPKPSWQASSGVPGIAAGGNRETPDVSASADPSHGVTIYLSSSPPLTTGRYLPSIPRASTGGGWTMIGGTSSASPMWAAFAAEIAASGSAGTSCSALATTTGGQDLGFVAPELYTVAASHYAAAFNDIVLGSNDVFNLGGGYRATSGYDPASGLGSPKITNDGAPGLAAYLCDVATGAALVPPSPVTISSMSPQSGPTTGGGVLTVSLAKALPQGAIVSAQIGVSPATVIAAAGSTVTLQIPASSTTGSAERFSAAGPAKVTLIVASSSGATTSTTTPASLYYYLDESGASTVPTVVGVGPGAGSPNGGNVVSVYGSGFGSGQNSVTFGGVSSTSVSVLNANQLRVVVPPETPSTACARGAGFDPSAACQVEVVVTNADGASPIARILRPLSGAVKFDRKGVVEPTHGTEVAASATEYDYSRRPTITSVTPSFADSSGSSPITIRGRGFSFVTFDWVNIGPYSDTKSEQVKIRYISATTIVIDPPSVASTVPTRIRGGLSVQTGGGLSNVVRFGYAGIPEVRHLSSRSGPTTGGSDLTITGSAAVGTTSVRFVAAGGLTPQPLSETVPVSLVRGSFVSLRTPRHAAGTVDVELCTATGCSRPDPLSDSYTFLAPK